MVSGLLVRLLPVLEQTGLVGSNGLQISHWVLVEVWQSRDNVAERQCCDEVEWWPVTVDGRDPEKHRKRWVWRVWVMVALVAIK